MTARAHGGSPGGRAACHRRPDAGAVVGEGQDPVFGMFALMAEYEAALIAERTNAGLQAARARGRKGGRKPKMTPELIDKAQRMYDSRKFTMAEIASSCAVTPMTVYRNIRTGQPAGA